MSLSMKRQFDAASFNSKSTSKRSKKTDNSSILSRPSSTLGMKKFLNDYEERTISNITASNSKSSLGILSKNGDQEFEKLKKTIINKKKLTESEHAAEIIQRCWRTYKCHKLFSIFMIKYKSLQNRQKIPFFGAWVLSTNIFSIDRRKLLKKVQRESLLIMPNSIRMSNSEFATTGLLSLSSEKGFKQSNTEQLVLFTRSLSIPMLTKIFDLWRIESRKQVHQKQLQQTSKFEKLKQIHFGNFYVCFKLWFNFTQKHRNKNQSKSNILPQWNHFIQIQEIKKRKIAKADQTYINNLELNAVQALRISVLNAHHRENQIKEADISAKKRLMKRSISAWLRVLVIQTNRLSSMKFTLRRWLQTVMTKKHYEKCLKQFKERSNFLSKQYSFFIFLKNRRISLILKSYTYLKIQQRPSLAIGFISKLIHNDELSALARSFNAWMSFTRKRHNWQQFVFSDIAKSNYAQLQQKGLWAIRQESGSPPLIPISILSKQFQSETLSLYTDVMKDVFSFENKAPFLMFDESDPHAAELKKELVDIKTKKQARDIFLKAWTNTQHDISLFSRIAILNKVKQKTLKERNEEEYQECVQRIFNAAMGFFIQQGLASERKLREVQDIIKENCRRAYQNRRYCLHRDKFILTAHEAHGEANNLHDLIPKFITRDEIQLPSKYPDIVPLIPIANLEPGRNDENFTNIALFLKKGMKELPSFTPQIIAAREEAEAFAERTEVGREIANHFDRLLAGYENGENASKGLKSMIKFEAFSLARKIEAPKKPIPKPTGVSPKLLETFPADNRKPRVIKKKTEHFAYNLNESEENLNSAQEEEEIREIKRLSVLAKKNSSKNIMKPRPIPKAASSINFVSEITFPSTPNQSNITKEPEEVKTILKEMVKKQESELSSDSYEKEDKREPLLIKIKENDNSDSSETLPSPLPESPPNLNEGFSDKIMKSANLSAPFENPSIELKYRAFLEILFGKGTKDIAPSQLQAMRKRLITEMRNRRSSLASHGVETQYVSMPVSGLIEKYRESTIPDKEQITTNYISKDKSKQYDDQSQYITKYCSRKYRRIPSNTNDEDSGSSDDEKFHEEFQYKTDLISKIQDEDNFQNKELSDDEEYEYEYEYYDEEEEISKKTEKDISNSDQDQSKSNPGEIKKTKRRKRKIAKNSLPSDDKLKNDGTMINTINSIAFSILNDNIMNDSIEANLVETDELDDRPHVDFDSLKDNENENKSKKITHPKIEKPKKKPRHFSMKRSTLRISPDYENRPLSELAALRDGRGLPTLQISGSGNRRIPGIQPYVSEIRIAQTHHKTEQRQLQPLKNFPLEGQVVSFAGHGRQVGTESPNFVKIRIQNLKQRNLTRPMSSLKNEDLGEFRGQYVKNENWRIAHEQTKDILSHMCKLLVEGDSNFEKFKRKVIMMLKKPSSKSSNNTQPSNLDPPGFYNRLQDIYIKFITSKNNLQCENDIYDLVSQNLKYQKLLLLNCEIAMKLNSNSSDMDETKSNSNLSQTSSQNPTLSISTKKTSKTPIKAVISTARYMEMNGIKKSKPSAVANCLGQEWIQLTKRNENPVNSITLQFNEDNPSFDALLSKPETTQDKTRKDSAKKSKQDSQSQKNWDELLDEYTMDELMLVTPYIFSEQIIDEVLRLK